MNSLKPFLIILTTGFLSFTGGYSAYFLPKVLGSRAASTTNQQPRLIGGQAATSNPASSAGRQQPVRARMWLQEAEPQRGSTSESSESTITINQSETLDIDLIINANGQIINGIDALISYDPTLLSLESIQPQKAGPFEAVIRKETYQDKIYLTAVKETPDEIPTNELTLATITLKGLKSATTALNFDHFPGKTYGSTIIRASDSENILDQVSSATILIQ